MSSLTAIVPLTITSKASPDVHGGKLQFAQSGLVKHVTRSPCFQSRKPISDFIRLQSATVICAAALNAKCGAEQTQTVTRQAPTSVITNAPIQGKEKSPELDDGGTGLPPRDDDGGGGGGGGGGGWKGGFFFFGFLAFLGLLKDQENEGPYREERRR
ncbi:protein FERTILITY RESTORER RF2, mitochondrial isoform X2 [Telopea speciosissima]|uniref:protein FERTILITY RESTORER RF2, mitochondrial isoform X2 n=1 Tax=Telopea speciosissima TaxID=54955 RepID=UPI001CC71715|nr:protein FERTILITY RESTORER RF2, mitochondrial isoform X2 [Telopea speciosissima]